MGKKYPIKINDTIRIIVFLKKIKSIV